MSLSIVTVGNLGEKINLKTTEILPVIDTFAKKGELTQVICQINTHFYFQNTSSAIPKLIRYFIRIAEIVTRLPLESIRKWLFDYFASRKLKQADIVFLHPLRFGRVGRKAKQNGSIVVALASIAHPTFDEAVYREECERYGGTISKEDVQIFRKRGKSVDDFDYILTFSEFNKMTYVKAGFPEEKIFVASLDIPLDMILPKKEIKKFKVLYVAYNNPRKGLPYLLDAWDDLNLSNAELVLVGKDVGQSPEIGRYCNEIIRRNSSITWVGGTTDPWPYYTDASVFVLPSISECYGKVTLEAMATGVPVIVTENARAIVEDGKTGFVVPIRDPKAIKEKIEYLYYHRDIAQKMGHEARRAVENKKSFGEEVYEIYQEIMRREGK